MEHEHEYSKRKTPDLAACECKPIAEYRGEGSIGGDCWHICANLKGPDDECLPVHLHVRRSRAGGYSIELESDQTDYAKANETNWVIKRARLGRVYFWGK